MSTLLKAFKLTHDEVPQTQLVIVGYSTEMQQMRQKVEELGLSEAVHFLGKHRNIPEIMAAMDVYVNSLVYESMSNTILEAMSCGVPVVATTVGGTPAIVRHDSTGLLVPPSEPEQMSAAILRLLSDRNKRETLAGNARRYVERHHRYEEPVKRYQKLYLQWHSEKLALRQPRTLKHAAKAVVGNTCRGMGILRWRNKLGRNSIFIINYHRVLSTHEKEHYLFQSMVNSVGVFERHMDFFRRRCHVMSLDECVTIIRDNLPIPDRTVVITFDDAYEDTYSVAKPILEKYELPATVFLPVGLIDENKSFWFDDVAQRLQYSDLRPLVRSHHLPVECAGILHELQALPAGQRDALARQAVQSIINLPGHQRAPLVQKMLHLESNSNGVLDNSLLDWQKVREMSATGLISFGSHSFNHLPLDLLSEDELVIEIKDSKKLLEERIGRPTHCFSYPWGRYDVRVKAKVKEFGYRSAVELSDAPNFAGEDLFELKRVDAAYLTLDHRFHEGMMVAELSGFNHFMRSRFRTFRSGIGEVSS